jgi:hypothetical protein
MSAAPPGLMIIAFAALDGGVWGAGVSLNQTSAVVGIEGRQIIGGPEATTVTGATGKGNVSAPGVDLSVEPLGGGQHSTGTAELCRVHGQVKVNGTERTVDCPGVRTQGAVLEPAGLDSLRGVWSWFEDEQGLAVIAARPQGASGQDTDRISATLFDAQGPADVADPRLSTTYGSDGLPARVGLELWVGDDDQQYPHRAAGEGLGAGARLDSGQASIQVVPLRCHSRGLDGSGVYMLARF